MSSLIQAFETGRANPRQTDLARQEALDKARETFDRFRAESPDDVTMQKQAAAVHRYAANVARLVNDYASAEKAYAAALGIWEDLSTRFADEPVYRDNLAQTLRDYAMFQKRLGKLREATANMDRATALADGAWTRTPAAVVSKDARHDPARSVRSGVRSRPVRRGGAVGPTGGRPPRSTQGCPRRERESARPAAGGDGGPSVAIVPCASRARPTTR